jgi:O-antigen/teichoic acid export membrane protein
MSLFEHIKSLYKDASILSVAMILQKSVGFLMLPIYAYYLRSEGYGIIGMLGVMTAMMTVFIGYGMKGAIQRYYFLEESDLDKKKTVSTGILVLIILSVAISAPALVGSKVISWLLFGKPEFYPYVALAAITFIAEMTSQGGEAYILILKKTYFYSLLVLASTVVILGLNIYFVIFKQMGVLGVLYSNLINAIFVSLTLNLKAFLSVGLHFERKAAKNILKYNIPMIPGFIAMFIRSNVDKIILRSFLGIETLGVYMMLLKLASMISVLITTPFLKIWTVKRLEICDQDNGPELISNVFNLQTSLILFVGLVLAVEIPYILMSMTPEEFWVPSYYALLAVLPPIMISSYYHFNFGIVYSRLTFKISKIHFITASASCLLNYLFIREFGLLGALFASVLVYSLQVVITHLMSRKHYFIPFAWAKLSKIFIGFITLFFAIDALSIRNFDFLTDITINAKPALMTWLEQSHLVTHKIGEKLFFLINNLEITLEALFKCGLTFSFILWSYFVGIVPRKRIRAIFSSIGRKKTTNSHSRGSSCKIK